MICSSTSSTSRTRVAPCRINRCAPEESGESIRPGTAKTSRPHSLARRAVMSEPLRNAASITTVPRVMPARMRLRAGKCARERSGAHRPLAEQRPFVSHALGELGVLGRVDHVDRPSRAPRPYSRGPPARLRARRRRCRARARSRRPPPRASGLPRAHGRPRGRTASRAARRRSRRPARSKAAGPWRSDATARRAARGGAAGTRDRRDAITRAPAAGRARPRARRPRRRPTPSRAHARGTAGLGQSARAAAAPRPDPPKRSHEPPSEDVADPRRRPQRNPR